MQWFRRPTVTLYAPKRIVPGQRLNLKIRLDASRPMAVAEVRVQLVATCLVQIPHTPPIRVFAQSTSVGQSMELAVGSTTVNASFEIPDTVLGTYLGRLLRLAWSVTVRAVVPGWLDRVSVFSLNVEGTSGPTAQDEHVVFASDPEGPGEKRPYMEVTLGTTLVQPGDVVSLATAFANVAHNRYVHLEVTLLATERARSAQVVREHAGWRFPLDEELAEGRAVQVQLRLPNVEHGSPSFVPGFETRDMAVGWRLRVRGRVEWGRDVEVWIPITIARQVRAGDPQSLAQVGNERVDLVWDAVARATGASYSDGVLRSSAGGASIVIERVAQDGPRVVRAMLEFPDLGIGFGLTAHAGWFRSDRRSVVARDPDQRVRVEAALTDLLTRANAVSASDSAVVCELRGAGYRERPVIAFVQRVRALAEGLERCRLELPFPASLAPESPDWERAAQELDGVLEPAAPRIRASGIDSLLEIGIDWSKEAAPDTILSVTARRAIADRHCGEWVASESGAWLAPPAHVVRAVLATAERVRIGGTVARSWFGPKVPMAAIVAAARELSQWIEAVTRSGPYR